MGGMDSLNVTGKILVELEKILANKEHKIKVFWVARLLI